MTINSFSKKLILKSIAWKPNNPIRSSMKKYSLKIVDLQVRHFPSRITKEINGIISNQFKRLEHWSQAEGLISFCVRPSVMQSQVDSPRSFQEKSQIQIKKYFLLLKFFTL